MHDNLVQRLLFAETDFLDALQNGSQMLSSYCEALSALPNALSTARKTGEASNETLSLAHSVASRIMNLANCFLDIKREEEHLTSQLQSDCDAMFRQMAALDINDQPKSSPSVDARTSTLNVESPSLVFAPACQWLLDNLHNPYPTAEVKARIAAASSCQVSSINSWFINTRRRIGWTTLCREHFSNCRADMLDAAYRALVEEDPQRVLSPELRHSFVAMRVAAEGLYSSTFTRSAFSADLDVMIKDVSKENEKSVRMEKCSLVDKVCLSGAAENSYPSPDPSTTSSPVPTLVDPLKDESEEKEDVEPLVIAGSKRRRSSLEPVDQPSSRPIKRLRASMMSRTCLPSPPASTDGVDELSDHGSPELTLPHSVPPVLNEVSPSPMRRISDADTTAISKQPIDSIAISGLQIVSDPLPRSIVESEYSIDEWFRTNFDDLFTIPPPVDATEPDLSVSWEVELFKDYDIPGNPECAPKCHPAYSPGSAPVDLVELDILLQSIGNDTLCAPTNSVFPSNVTGAAYMTPLNSSTADILQTNINWTSLLNGTEVYQPTVYPTFHQGPTDFQPLPEIDLSMLQLPQVMPADNSQSDFASKQAKLHQLHAMQEAVWRMEHELRSEGVVL